MKKVQQYSTPVFPAGRRCPRCGETISGFGPEGLCGSCLLNSGLAAEEPLEPVVFDVASRRFGDYELLEEIARGGMGVVFKARQISLNRIVAVKMILRGELAGVADLARFRAEAETAARLQHPNIVAIHEVGEREGQPYFSMDYVAGKNLAQLVGSTPMSAPRAAKYLKTIAEAVHYAHQRGVLHRDLKPSNVLIDSATDEPRVTDFGLAKRLDPVGTCSTASLPGGEKIGEALKRGPTYDLTVTGQVLGSPNFMPPEQAAGKSAALGSPSDVYSLGALLYHLLTGRPPFVAESITTTLRLVAENEAVSPRLLNGSVPRDLETICLMCLHKESGRRYQSAQDLADELDRFLCDKPIQSRPVSQAEKAWRWCRRHPAVAVLSVAVFALLLAVTISSTVSAGRLRQAAAGLKQANQRAADKLCEAYIGQARAERWSGRAGRRSKALELLRNAAEIRPANEIRNEAIASLALEDMRTIGEIKLPPYSGFAFEVNFSQYHIADESGTIILRRIADGSEVSRLPGWGPGHYSFGVAHDETLVCAFCDSEAKHVLGFYVRDEHKFKFSITNRFSVKTGDYDQVENRYLFCWNATPSALMSCSATSGLKELASLSVPAVDIRVSPDGERISLVKMKSKEVEVRGAGDGQIVLRIPLPDRGWKCDWHPNGHLLAVGCADHLIHLFDTATGKEQTSISGHLSEVTGVYFTHDGNRLASFSWDNTFRLWNVWNGQQILTRACFGEASAFSEDDRMIALTTGAAMDLCEMAGRLEWRCFQALKTKMSEGEDCSWSPDGKLLISRHKDGVRLWDVGTGCEADLPATGPSPILALAFHPSGRNLVAATEESFCSWGTHWAAQNVTPPKLVLEPVDKILANGNITRFEFNARGTTMAATIDAAIQTLQWPTGRLLHKFRLETGVLGWALSPSGRFCVAWPFSGTVPRTVWDVTTGAILTNIVAMGAYGAAFTPDDQLLITGSCKEYVAWDTRSWSPVWNLARPKSTIASGLIAISRDGKMGAATFSADTVRLFEPTTGREIATLEAPESQAISWLAFSPQGNSLAVLLQRGIVSLWDLSLTRRELAELKLDWDIAGLPESR